MRLPIRTRLTLVFASTTLLVLVISAVALLLGFRRAITATVDEALLERASALAADPPETYPR